MIARSNTQKPVYMYPEKKLFIVCHLIFTSWLHKSDENDGVRDAFLKSRPILQIYRLEVICPVPE